MKKRYQNDAKIDARIINNRFWAAKGTLGVVYTFLFDGNFSGLFRKPLTTKRRTCKLAACSIRLPVLVT